MEKMKTIKISPDVHKNVKVYVASIEGQTISDFADFALINAMRNFPPKKQISKPKNNKP
jgi:hypothetical protein